MCSVEGRVQGRVRLLPEQLVELDYHILRREEEPFWQEKPGVQGLNRHLDAVVGGSGGRSGLERQPKTQLQPSGSVNCCQQPHEKYETRA